MTHSVFSELAIIFAKPIFFSHFIMESNVFARACSFMNFSMRAYEIVAKHLQMKISAKLSVCALYTLKSCCSVAFFMQIIMNFATQRREKQKTKWTVSYGLMKIECSTNIDNMYYSFIYLFLWLGVSWEKVIVWREERRKQ